MPAICRGDLKDLDVTHCSRPKRRDRSDDVLVNGIGISRQTDVNHPHLIPEADTCSTHEAPITTGSTEVFVNGLGCGRIGDAVTNCTKVATGSADTFAGPQEIDVSEGGNGRWQVVLRVMVNQVRKVQN